MEKKVYLDNNSTTQLDPRVLTSMLQELEGPPANPSSTHFFGRKAKKLLFESRQTVASFLKVPPQDLLFTSGATEAIHLFLHGIQGHIITTRIEHSSIFHTAEKRRKEGLSVSYVPVGALGAPSKEEIEKALQKETKAIVLSASNSETGVMIDLEEIAHLAFQKGVPLFLDAVSFLGKEKLFSHPGIGAIVASAHKFHGPKGVGALYLHPSLEIPAQILGGAQEHQKRAGTENLAGILGLAKACEILLHEQDKITKYLSDLRALFEEKVKQTIPHTLINGEGKRVCNTSNLSFAGVDGETLLIQLDLAGIAASHGSACSSQSLEPSRVLLEMGLARKRVKSSIRFSFSKMNRAEEVLDAADVLARLVSSLRSF